MSLTVRPDPKHPSGGYAVIDAPEGAVSGSEALVSVFDSFSQRFLGAQGWQATKVEFGPYPVDRAGGTASIRIGPEIVNQIEEYAALRLTVGGHAGEVNWPDDVVPRPGAAVLGGIHVSRAEAAPKADNLVGKKAAVVDTGAVTGTDTGAGGATTGTGTGTIIDSEPDEGGRGRGPLIAGVLIALLIAAGAAWYLMQEPAAPVVPEPAPVVETEPTPEPEPPAPVASGDDCSTGALAALAEQDFAATLATLGTCGSRADASAVLGLIEKAADRNDPLALVQFGELYDAQAGGSVVEQAIGLTFDDDPAKAAEYYARARDTGSSVAEERLRSLCTRMAGSDATLVQAAVEEYCPQ